MPEQQIRVSARLAGSGSRKASSRHGLALLLLAIPLSTFTANAQTAAGSTALVSRTGEAGTRTLLSALQDNSVQHIIVQQPVYNVRSEFESYQGRPLAINRNITISGGSGVNTVLDLDFVASAIQLCSTCTVQFANITLANERHGTGETVDFVVGKAGSKAAVLFVNCNKLRLACTAAEDAAAVIADTPRSQVLAGTSGKQRTTIMDVTFQGKSYPGSLHFVDLQVDVPFMIVEGWRGGSGGYALVAENVTRLCRQTIDPSCFEKATPEACVVDRMDEVKASQDQKPSSGSKIGAAVGGAVAGVVVIAAAIGAFCWVRRRQLSQQGGKPASGSSGSKPKLSLPPSGGGATSGYDDDLAEAGGVDVEQLRMFDSFIEGCNFVRAPLGVRKGWEVSKVMTSPYSENAAPDDKKDIQLGQFLGAGSFGRVYRARWGGRDVAVKVIEHNSDASSAVESEVELMFRFSNHPNIVRAYYAITYTQNTIATIGNGNGTGSSSSNNHGRDTGGYALNSSGGSSSNRQGFVSGGSSQRAALARLRSMPLHEVVVEDGPAAAGDEELLVQRPTGAAMLRPIAAGSSTPNPRDVISNRQPPLERIDSEPVGEEEQLPERQQQQRQQQQQQQLHVTPHSTHPSTASDQDQGSASGSTSGIRAYGSAGAYAASNTAVQGSAQGSTDCVSRVYNWMGTNSSPPPGLMGAPMSGGRRPGEPGEAAGGGGGGREKRAETWLVQEFCDLGTLGSIVTDWNPSEESDVRMLQRLLLLRDAAQGLKLLHSMNTVHGDLTARNVLVSSSKEAQYGMVAKLADLGLSRVIKLHRTHRTTNTVGTLSHMPPELLRYGHCSTAVDVYAFGVMMWELYTNKAAFNKLQYGQFYETVVLRNLRPLVPQGMAADYSLLMQHCWASDPLQRPNVDRVLHCLNLMIVERQERLSELNATASSRVQSAPLPMLPPRLPRDLAARAPASFSAKKQIFSAPPDGVFRHRSCPGPGGANAMPGPLFGPAAAAIAAAAAARAKAELDEDNAVEQSDVGMWKGPPSRFSWGDRSLLGCSTPSAPLRPPLPLLRRYVSDEYGTELQPQEETWFV